MKLVRRENGRVGHTGVEEHPQAPLTLRERAISEHCAHIRRPWCDFSDRLKASLPLNLQPSAVELAVNTFAQSVG